MEEIRGLVDDTVKDPEVAEKLKAYYNQFCKRPTFNDFYLDTFNRPNVELVDVSATQGVEAITENGIIANGKEYSVDCIVYASGFEITSVMSGVSASRSSALAASRFMNIGKKACAPCMD